MEKFYIITNDMKDANRKITVKIKKCIESYGKKCYLEEQPEEGNFSKIKIPKDIDCVLTVGGDGTFIQASRRLFGRELPMLGINMGTLGYLTEVEVQNVEEAVKQLVEGNYTIEERMMLYGSAAYRNVRDVALNDIVMTRSGSMKIVHFNLYVRDRSFRKPSRDKVLQACGRIDRVHTNGFYCVQSVCRRTDRGADSVIDRCDTDLLACTQFPQYCFRGQR